MKTVNIRLGVYLLLFVLLYCAEGGGWNPRQKPLYTGAVPVGVVFVRFPDLEEKSVEECVSSLSRLGSLSQEEYFKAYSHGIAWPDLKFYPEEDMGNAFLSPHCFGYYCRLTANNLLGYSDEKEGDERMSKLRNAALEHARRNSKTIRDCKVFAICVPSSVVRNGEDLREVSELKKAYKAEGNESTEWWKMYSPEVRWRDPMWSDASIHLCGISPGTLAHEFGHVLGAPDVYRVRRDNDGIGGAAALMTYGPTSSGFSLSYHHGFVKEQNYPLITRSGSYTLYPRHKKPEGNEAVGYFIPSCHPDYYYHIEYVNNEHRELGVATPKGENVSFGIPQGGLLISVFSPGKESYLGSPDVFYTYRPGDPFFRGKGDIMDCMFGPKFGRTEFTASTDPGTRLPCLIDGGVEFKNIRVNGDGTASFDVEIKWTNSVSGGEYVRTLIPQIKLGEITNILPTSLNAEIIPKYRGYPPAERYGICWGTCPHPTIKNARAVLMHREVYSLAATDLKPNTRYYVRAFVMNKWGINYSDEEKMVKTPSAGSIMPEVSRMMIDLYSSNYLAARYCGGSLEYTSSTTRTPAAGVSMAKLAAFHHPKSWLRTYKLSKSGSKGSHRNNDKKNAPKLDFDQLHYDPWYYDPPFRTEMTKYFLNIVRMRTEAAEMNGVYIETDKWFRKFKKEFPSWGTMELFRVSSSESLNKKLKKELSMSRPILVFGQSRGGGFPVQWGVITGYSRDGAFLFEFPYGNLPTVMEIKKGSLDKLSENETGVAEFYVITGIKLK